MADSQALHPILVRSVANALHSIFKEGKYADKVIEQVLRSNPKAGSRDRAFIAENTYDIVRYFRLYTELLGKKPDSEDDFWEIAGIHFLVSAAGTQANLSPSDMKWAALLPAWREFQSIDSKALLTKWISLQSQRAIRESIPDWLDDTASKELPEAWDETLVWLNKTAPVVLRTNLLKTDRKQLQQQLYEEGVESEPRGDGAALVLKRRQNVFGTKAFKSGYFELQDYSSQLVAPYLKPEPGMRVVDACAGGGGKALHLAALMQNKGSLIALDTMGWKLDALRLRARRAGATNIETRPIENRKTIKRLYGTADRLLLDVPCSGLGVLRRNPDSKWKLSTAQLDQLRNTQQDILQQYCPIIKPGGLMVYATCSILPSENEGQVAKFLASEAGKGFAMTTQQSILPQDDGFDGFYMALLERR